MRELFRHTAQLLLVVLVLTTPNLLLALPGFALADCQVDAVSTTQDVTDLDPFSVFSIKNTGVNDLTVYFYYRGVVDATRANPVPPDGVFSWEWASGPYPDGWRVVPDGTVSYRITGGS